PGSAGKERTFKEKPLAANQPRKETFRPMRFKETPPIDRLEEVEDSPENDEDPPVQPRRRVERTNDLDEDKEDWLRRRRERPLGDASQLDELEKAPAEQPKRRN